MPIAYYSQILADVKQNREKQIIYDPEFPNDPSYDGYNAVIQAAVILFGKKACTIEDKGATLIVRGYMPFFVSFSGNEHKAYITIGDPEHFSTSGMVNSNIKSFRYFDMAVLVQWMQKIADLLDWMAEHHDA